MARISERLGKESQEYTRSPISDLVTKMKQNSTSKTDLRYKRRCYYIDYCTGHAIYIVFHCLHPRLYDCVCVCLSGRLCLRILYRKNSKQPPDIQGKFSIDKPTCIQYISVLLNNKLTFFGYFSSFRSFEQAFNRQRDTSYVVSFRKVGTFMASF